MTIKYAEITIIKNLEQKSALSYLYDLFGYEHYTFTDDDAIIISFDDGTICDVNNNKFNGVFDFGPKSHLYNSYPVYFKLNEKTLFLKDFETDENNVRKLDIDKELFKNYNKNGEYKKIPSCNNICYDMYEFGCCEKSEKDLNKNYGLGKKDVFCIIKIQSSEDKPRFILAYHDKVFDKPNLIHLIDCIFKHRFENENIDT